MTMRDLVYDADQLLEGRKCFLTNRETVDHSQASPGCAILPSITFRFAQRKSSR